MAPLQHQAKGISQDTNTYIATFAFGLLLPSNKPARANGRIRLAIMLFVFSAVIFRSEIALLLATNALWLLITPQISLHRLVPPFVVSFVLSVTISVLVDSYFWQKWLWPELWGFYYNVVQGSSSNWGTSPWYYYFLSAIPRLLMLALPCMFVALWSPAYYRIAQRLVIPNLLFVAIYSLQPHKEARFIFYVVPPLTGAAALGAAALTMSTPAKKNSSNSILTKNLTTAVLVGAVLLNSLASTVMLLASSINYPGGEALAALHALLRADQDAASASLVTVHADVLSCMTGVTLFGVAGGDNVPTRHNFLADGELVVAGSTNANGGDDGGESDSSNNNKASAWLFLDKTEDPVALADPGFWQRFDYLLMEDEAAVRGGQWDTVAAVEGLAGFEVLRPGGGAAGDEKEKLAGAARVGGAARVAALRDRVRGLTGGWWVGPRLAPKIRIMKRLKDGGAADRAAKETVAVA